MTSFLVTQTQCPRCKSLGNDRSGDNLAVYSDGHEWCYRCGFFKGSNGVERLLLENANKALKSSNVYLPMDSSLDYPTEAIKWIEGYELNSNHLLLNNVLWSEEEGRLIFPHYDEEGVLLAWQGRKMREGIYNRKGKWYGKGNLKDLIDLHGRSSNKLVLVEDIISAIKVGEVYQCMPLHGSFISFDRWRRVKSLIKEGVRVYVWLDKDKQKDSVKFSRLGRAMGVDATSIITDLDPKEYSLLRIKEILDN